MRTRRRKNLAFVASALVHGSILAGPLLKVQCIPEFELPEIDIEMVEIELIDPDAIQGDDPDPQPEPPPAEPEPPAAEPPPPTPEDPAAQDTKPPPEPEPEPEPKPKPFADRRSRADKLAPPQSTFHMLLVPKKIRRLPFSQQVLDIMAPLPDFELLIDGGRFDALRDFDHIVVASPDIRDWTQTFLAVDYTLPREEVQRAIERAVASRDETIEWVQDDGPLRGNPRPTDPEEEDADNRWFVFLEGKVAIYVRDEFLPSILEGPATDDRKTAGNFVANLSRLRRFSARQPKAGLQLVFSGINRGIKGRPKIGGKPLPFDIPDGFELSASAEAEPQVLLRFEFGDVVEAKAFMNWWDEDLRALIDDNFTIKLQAGWMYDLFELERDGKQVRLTGQMTTDQAEKVMQFAADGSRRVAKKTPEEVEQMRQRRIEAIKARRGGKLPPSALDPQEENPDETAEDPAAPPAGPAGPAPSPPGEPSAPGVGAPKPTKPTTEGDDGDSAPG